MVEQRKLTKADDPDETAGRALYRAKAEALATAQVTVASRKVKMRNAARAALNQEDAK